MQCNIKYSINSFMYFMGNLKTVIIHLDAIYFEYLYLLINIMMYVSRCVYEVFKFVFQLVLYLR